MSAKKILFVLVSVAVTMLVFAGSFGTAQARQPAVERILKVRLAENVALEGVTIDSDHSLTFRGEAQGQSGNCLPVEIYVEGERQSWWPVYRCVHLAESGQWTLRVPSDDGGRPVAIQLMVGE